MMNRRYPTAVLLAAGMALGFGPAFAQQDTNQRDTTARQETANERASSPDKSQEYQRRNDTTDAAQGADRAATDRTQRGSQADRQRDRLDNRTRADAAATGTAATHHGDAARMAHDGTPAHMPVSLADDVTVYGPHNQELGETDSLIIDTRTGRVAGIVIDPASDDIEADLVEVSFDALRIDFKGKADWAASGTAEVRQAGDASWQRADAAADLRLVLDGGEPALRSAKAFEADGYPELDSAAWYTRLGQAAGVVEQSGTFSKFFAEDITGLTVYHRASDMSAQGATGRDAARDRAATDSYARTDPMDTNVTTDLTDDEARPATANRTAAATSVAADGEATALGTISDIIVDGRTGDIRFYVVEADLEAVTGRKLVPAQAFTSFTRDGAYVNFSRDTLASAADAPTDRTMLFGLPESEREQAYQAFGVEAPQADQTRTTQQQDQMDQRQRQSGEQRSGMEPNQTQRDDARDPAQRDRMNRDRQNATPAQ